MHTIDRELLRAFAREVSAEHFQPFLDRYLVLVHSAACRQMGVGADAQEVTRAVFLAFARSARRLRRNTVVAGWLLRASCYAARRLQRSRGRSDSRTAVASSEPPSQGDDPSWSRLSPLLDRSLGRLPGKLRDAVLLRCILGWNQEDSSAALRLRPAKVEKRLLKGLRRLAQRLRKGGVGITESALRLEITTNGCTRTVPPEFGARLLSEAELCFRKKPTVALARSTLAAFTRARWKGRFKIAAVAFASFVGLIGILALCAVLLWRSGRLLPWLIEFGGRMQARGVPGLSQPARPWPNEAMSGLPSAANLQSAAELYSLTNIWQAHLRFSADQWAGLAPKRIKPVPKLVKDDGTVVLRNPNARRSGLAGALGLDFNWVTADLELSGASLTNVAARFRGNGTYVESLYGPKRSFKVDVSKYVKHRAFAGVHTIDFANLITDRSYMSDALGYRFFRDAGVPAPRTAYAWITVTATGKWERKPLGLYLVLENVDAQFAVDRFGTKKTAVLKPVTYDLFQDLGNDWGAYAQIYDPKTKLSEAQKQRVIDFARLLTHANDAEFGRLVGSFLDLDEFARFLSGLVLLSSYDGFLTDGQNFYLYIDPRSNKFGFIPWDLDHAWGGFPLVGTEATREEASIWHPWTGRNRLLERLMGSEDFRRNYRARLEELLTTVFEPARLYRQIDEIALLIRGPIAAESTFRLERFDQAVSTNWSTGPRDGDTGPTRPVHQLKRFIMNRARSVRDQLDGTSQGVIPQSANFTQK